MSREVNTRCLGDEALEELKVAIEHVCRPQTIGSESIRLDQVPGKRGPQLERVRRVLEDVHFQQMFISHARERIVLSRRVEEIT